MLLVILVVLAALDWTLLQGWGWKLRKIPGPVGLPLLGNLVSLVRKGSPLWIHEIAPKYGAIFKFWYGGVPNVIVTDPDVGRKLNNKCLARPSFDFILLIPPQQEPTLSSLLITVRGTTWRLGRKAFDASIINPSSLIGHLAHLDSCAQRFADVLQSVVASGDVIDIWRRLGDMSLAAVGTCAYGLDFHTLGAETGSQQQQAQELVECCKVFFQTGSYGKGSVYQPLMLLFPSLIPLIKWLAFRLPDAPLRAEISSRQKLLDISQQIVDEWRVANSEKGQGLQKNSFLSSLLEARSRETGEKLSDPQVVAQVITFILAGYETTANALAFMIYCLSTNPRVEAHLVQEIKEKVPDLSQPVTEEQLNGLPYLEAVVKETLRLYPPAVDTVREMTEDVVMDGVTLPKGVWVTVASYTMHRDPRYWQRPEEFLPERFLPGGEALGPSNPNAYIPFGAGPRMCVGYKFALLEAKVVLLRLYQRFTFKLDPSTPQPLKVEHNTTLSPVGGIKVQVLARG